MTLEPHKHVVCSVIVLSREKNKLLMCYYAALLLSSSKTTHSYALVSASVVAKLPQTTIQLSRCS